MGPNTSLSSRACEACPRGFNTHARPHIQPFILYILCTQITVIIKSAREKHLTSTKSKCYSLEAAILVSSNAYFV
jgi:hypothetical protein